MNHVQVGINVFRKLKERLEEDIYSKAMTLCVRHGIGNDGIRAEFTFAPVEEASERIRTAVGMYLPSNVEAGERELKICRDFSVFLEERIQKFERDTFHCVHSMEYDYRLRENASAIFWRMHVSKPELCDESLVLFGLKQVGTGIILMETGKEKWPKQKIVSTLEFKQAAE